MITTTTEKMLKNIDLESGVLNVVIDTLVNWDNKGTQGKIETDVTRVIEDTINCNIAEYFDKSQVQFITSNFYSSENFLENFYKVNPNIGSIVHEAIHSAVEPIKLILDGVEVDQPLEHYTDYYEWFNLDLKILRNFSKIITKEQNFNRLIQKNV